MSGRDEVIATLLAGGAGAVAAADELVARDDWVTGPPPPELLDAWTAPGFVVADTPRHRVALAWDRTALSAALLDVVRAGADPARRESAAWLLKGTLDPAHSSAAARLALSPGEPVPVRRWLTEGLGRLAAGERVGWSELGDVVQALAADDEPVVRGGAVGLLMLLPANEDGTRMLLGLLDDPEAEVLAGALRALDGDADAVARIDPARLQALRDHPHPLVRSGAEALAALRESARPLG